MHLALYKSPIRALKLQAMTLPFVAIGVWMIIRSDAWEYDWWIGWLCSLFFGMGIPISLYNLFDRRPHIILNETGVFDRTLHRDIINWEVIQDAYPYVISNQKFIALIVSDEFKPSRKKSVWYQRMARMNEALGAQELNLNLSQVKADEVKLAILIKLLAKSPRAERGNLLGNFSGTESPG